jgi:FAD/FMN-containing dehydrogenase
MYGALFAGCYAIWRSPRSDRENVQWLEATMQAVGPMAAGHYVGEMDLLRWPAGRAYSPGQWQRLCALRRQLDPKGLFASPLSPTQCSTADENSALSRGS